MGIADSRCNSPRVGRTTWWICFPIALLDGYDTLVMSFLAPTVSRELALEPASFRGVFTATYAGAALGAVLLGTVADRYGRKPLLMLSLATAGVFTAATALVHSLEGLMWCRAFAGLGLGGAIPIISALAAANVSVDRKRAAVTRVFIGYPIGAIIGGLLTARLMGTVGWRTLMLATGALALVCLAIAARFLKETLHVPEHSRSIGNASSLLELFGSQYAWVTVTLSTAAFLILGVSYFLVSWIPTVLTLKGMSPKAAAATAVLLNVGGLVGAWGLSKVGDFRPATPLGIALCSGALLIAAFGPALHSTSYIVAASVFCMGVLVIGAQINIPALAAWLYPARSSAAGVGLAMAFGRGGSIAGPFIGGYLIASHMGWESMFQIAAIPTLLAGVALLILSRADR